MKKKSYFESLLQSPGMRLFLYLVILLTCSLIGILLARAVMFAGDLGLKIGQGISSMMMFIAPPILYYCLTRKERQMKALGFRKVTQPWLILIGVMLMLTEMPILNQLMEWNQAINLGPAFAKLEAWMKSLEESAETLTERMLDVDTVGGLLLNLFIIALIPAIGEEMTFRGVLQQSLTRHIKNPHVAILVSAAVFSFIHFQFYGFFARMLAGLMLGYMFYITGSLWVSILMHFINNGASVAVYYLYHSGAIDDLESLNATPSLGILIACVTAVVVLLVLSWKHKTGRKSQTNPIAAE